MTLLRFVTSSTLRASCAPVVDRGTTELGFELQKEAQSLCKLAALQEFLIQPSSTENRWKTAVSGFRTEP